MTQTDEGTQHSIRSSVLSEAQQERYLRLSLTSLDSSKEEVRELILPPNSRLCRRIQSSKGGSSMTKEREARGRNLACLS